MAEIEQALVVRMEASLAKFERQLTKATRQAGTSATAIEGRFAKMSTSMVTSSNRAGSALSRLTNISGSGRFVLQNTAAQFGDIAVQLEGGTAASRVLAQQLPQLLGGFGALGGALGIVAPLLGTIAAVGIPLAALFLNIGDGADEASEEIQGFAEKLSEAQSALAATEAALNSMSVDGIDALIERYGRLSDAVQDLLGDLAAVEISAATSAAGSAISEALGGGLDAFVTEAFGDIEAIEAEIAGLTEYVASEQARLQQLTENGLFVSQADRDNLAAAREELAAMLGDIEGAGSLSDQLFDRSVIDDIAAMEAGISAAVNAADFSTAADLLAQMRDRIEEAGVEMDAGVFAALVRSEDVARQMAARLDDSGDAGARLRNEIEGVETSTSRLVGALGAALGNLNGMVSSSSTLVGNMQAAASAAYSMLQNVAETQRMEDVLTGAYGLMGFTRERAPERPVGSPRPPARPADIDFGYTPPSGGGGRGSSGGGTPETPFFEDIENQIQAMERQLEMIGKTDAEVARLTAQYELLDLARERGLDLDAQAVGTNRTLREEIEAQAAAYAALVDQVDSRQESLDRLNDGISDIADTLAGVAVGTEDLADAFRSMLQRMAADLISSGIETLLQQAFSGIGGGGKGGVLASFIGGLTGRRSAGGSVSAGGVYEINERGQEFFAPGMSGQIISSEQLRSAFGGGSTGGIITVNIVASSEFEAMVTENSTGAAVQVVGQAMKQVPQIAQNAVRNPRQVIA